MAVKDWLPVAQDIYDTLIANGNAIQNLSHKYLCEILDKHGIAVTEDMTGHDRTFDAESFLVGVIKSTVLNKDLSKSLYDNGLFFGDELTDAEESLAYASHNIPKSLWVYQIAHKLQSAFKDPKAKEKIIEEDKEEIFEVSETKENANEDVGASVKSTKHDKFIKICSEIIEIKQKLGAVSISDLSKIIGKEFFSDSTTSNIFTSADGEYLVEVLEILNNISSIVFALSTEISPEDMLEHVKMQFDKLDEIAESLKDSNKYAEDKQLFCALEYMDSVKKSNPLKMIGINEMLKAFVVGEIIADESERIFLSGNAMMSTMQLMNFINASNFDIKDRAQVADCIFWLFSIKQSILLNKTTHNHFNDSTAGIGKQFPPPPMPGIDPKIYQKAAAFDKIVEALRPVFNELENQKPMQGFGFPLNGWESPFYMNSMFKV